MLYHNHFLNLKKHKGNLLVCINGDKDNKSNHFGLILAKYSE
jgi:hypothetical protein